MAFEVKKLYWDTFSFLLSSLVSQLESVECFKYLGSMLTNDGRCTCEIKCRIAMTKVAFNNKKNFLPVHWIWS